MPTDSKQVPLDVDPGDYHEEEDFKCYGDPEPRTRFQRIVHRSGGYKWHVKVTFCGTILRTGDTQDFVNEQKKRTVRGAQLRSFIRHIEFEKIPLIDDTVTEVIFEPSNANQRSDYLPLSTDAMKLPVDHRYRRFSGHFDYRVTEDVSKVYYPPLPKTCSVEVLPFSVIEKVADIAPTVSRVKVAPRKQDYIFKSIERPLYQPLDSSIIKQELLNLQLLLQSPWIVQLVSIIGSGNPYHTGRSKNHIVLRGFLEEYHTAGSLEDTLRTFSSPLTWKTWPIQIACGLQILHDMNITHMDVKLSNIVIDSKGDAKLIDISGLATTHEWVAPEMRECPDPISLPWMDRVCNDIWAFGRLLSTMIPLERDRTKVDGLNEIVKWTTREDPKERSSLDVVILRLDQILELYPSGLLTLP